jgi:hypothetical protein
MAGADPGFVRVCDAIGLACAKPPILTCRAARLAKSALRLRHHAHPRFGRRNSYPNPLYTWAEIRGIYSANVTLCCAPLRSGEPGNLGHNAAARRKSRMSGTGRRVPSLG